MYQILYVLTSGSAFAEKVLQDMPIVCMIIYHLAASHKPLKESRLHFTMPKKYI
jgi:hypothetical protein